MNDTMTPTEAARVLADASKYEDALVQRTEGLTLMVWGLVMPGIWLVSGALPPGWWSGFVWIPFVAAGAVTTWLVWRSAALSSPAPSWERPGPSFALRWLGFVAVLALAFFVIRPTNAAGPLVIVGAAWAAMAALDLWGSSRLGRTIWGACGAILILVGAALLGLRVAPASSLVVALATVGLVPLVAGAYQTLRG